MSTTPPVPTPATPAAPVLSTIDKDLQDSLASLAHKHVTVSYTLVGVLVLVLICGCIGAYFANGIFNKEVARAEADEKQMQQDKTDYTALNKTLTDTLAKDAADRTAWAQQVAQLVSQVAARNQVANQQITNVTQPGKSAEDAFADLHSAFKDNPTVESAALNVSKDPATGEQLMTFPVPAVQQFTATKIDRDRDAANLVSMGNELDLANQTNDSLKTDLTNTQAAKAKLETTEAACEKTVADYKKVVVPSRFKRILNGFFKGVTFVGGVAVGAVIGHYI